MSRQCRPRRLFKLLNIQVPSNTMPLRLSAMIRMRSIEKDSFMTKNEISMANNTLVSRSMATGAMRYWLNTQTMIA